MRQYDHFGQECSNSEYHGIHHRYYTYLQFFRKEMPPRLLHLQNPDKSFHHFPVLFFQPSLFYFQLPS